LPAGAARLLFALSALGVAAAAEAAGEVTPLVGHLETADACEVAHVRLLVDKGGPCTTTDGGNFVCDAPGLPGDEVRLLMPSHPKCLIFYPPDGRTTLKRPESRESVTITLVERGSPRWKSTEELRGLIRASTIKKDVQTLSPQQLDARLQGWLESVRAQAGQAGQASGEFAKLMVRKQGQIQEYQRVTAVFTKFLNRGQEMVEGFRRHASEAVGWIAAQEQLAAAIREYDEVFNEMREQGEAYQAIVLSYWGAPQAADYRRLLDAALDIHRTGIYRLNDVNELINRLNQKQIRGDKARQEATARVAALTPEITAQVEPRLADLRVRVDAYLAGLKESLAEF